MKNQKTKLELLFWVLLFAILALIYFNELNNRQPTYTQSDVSALTKFNASEFGCKDILITKSLTKDSPILKYFYDKNVTYNQLHVLCFSETSEHPIVNRIFTYFPQFDGVSVVVEPERQECVNETVEQLSISYRENKTYHDIILWEYYKDTGLCHKWASDSEVVVAKINGFNETHFECRTVVRSYDTQNITEQKCQTIPAVEKEINPWAVDESELATEFCRAKTYTTESINQSELIDECLDRNGIDRKDIVFGSNNIPLGGKISCGFSVDIPNQIKPFTRGEVVSNDSDMCKPLHDQWLRDREFGTKKCQKVIRCIGDDGTQKDFEASK